jgi:hypothetical protein
MFCNAHDNIVDKALLPYEEAIANDKERHVPGWSWGLAVLAATYWGLCLVCTKTTSDVGVHSYEWFAIAQSQINLNTYEDVMYHDDEEDMPNMGSLWTGPWVSTIVIA